MSAASQSRVKEKEEFKAVYDSQDCVLLWALICRTHLTHIFGDTDPMKEVNMQEQESKYALLRQGEREYISIFKARFDEQVLANDGVGVPAISDSKRALEFLLKLDQNRYRRMLAQMRNDALREVVDAYPRTLVSSYRIASQWTNEEHAKPAAGTDQAFVTATKDTDKKPGKPGKSKRKVVDPLTIHCYVCGDVVASVHSANPQLTESMSQKMTTSTWTIRRTNGGTRHSSLETMLASSPNTMSFLTMKRH